MFPSISILRDLVGFTAELIWLEPAPSPISSESPGKSPHLCEPRFPRLRNGCGTMRCADGYKALRARLRQRAGALHLDSSLCSQLHPPPTQRGYHKGGGAPHRLPQPPPPGPAGDLPGPPCVPLRHLESKMLPMARREEDRPFLKVLDTGKALGKYSLDEQMIILMITESSPEQLIQFSLHAR